MLGGEYRRGGTQYHVLGPENMMHKRPTNGHRLSGERVGMDPGYHAVDAGLDPPTSTLRAERIAARDVLDAWCVLHLSPRAASMHAR